MPAHSRLERGNEADTPFVESARTSDGINVYRATSRGESLLRSQWITPSDVLAVIGLAATIALGLISVGAIGWLKHHTVFRAVAALVS